MVVNAGGNGFYRVKYSEGLIKGIISNKKTIMTEVDRYNLLNDSWSLVRLLVSLVDYLKMVENFTDEQDPQIGSKIIGLLNYVHSVVEGPARAAVESKLRHVLQPLLDKLGYASQPGESVKVT